MSNFDFMANLYNPDGQPNKDFVEETDMSKHLKTVADFEKIGESYANYLEEMKNTPAPTLDEKNPTQMEATWTMELNSFVGELTNKINSSVQLIPFMGQSAIQSLIEYLTVAIPQLEAFRPKAESLSKAGSNQMSQRLEAILTDVKTAFTTYLQMYQGVVRNNIKIAGILNKSADDTTRTILETNINTQGVYDRANKNWDDNF